MDTENNQSGFKIDSFGNFQDMDFSESKNPENKTVTCKSKADNGLSIQ